MSAALLDVHALRQTFPRADGGELLVLDGIELQLAQGQIVGLLGRTGSGKSTLLRLIAGLAHPSNGTVSYLGQPVNAPAPGIAITAGERQLGTMGSATAGHGLALLRLDRVAEALANGQELLAGGVPIRLVKPDWARFAFPGDSKAAE